MRNKRMHRTNWLAIVSILVMLTTGCGILNNTPAAAPSPTVAVSPTKAVEATPAATAVVADKNLLYEDNFTNPASGWPEEKFDNYFVGYHEPEFYHIEITSPNYKTTVFAPGKQKFSDATVEVNVFTVVKKTGATGDFSYGTAFRRSGDNYYAFTISPRTKKWYLLKSSASALTVLTQGTEAGIQELGTADVLRVDIQGANFSMYINNKFVGQAKDADYATGEVGFFVQTVDVANVHVHFDSITIRKIDASQLGSNLAALYQDNFTNPASGWPEKKFDNYFVGYHEPEFYHIEITSPNYKTTVFEPDKRNFDNVTIEVKVFTVVKKTAATGDFNYGTAFRRSGDNYYAFTISPRTKKWYFLKSSSSALAVLKEGTEAGINDLGTADILRVDAQGSSFSLYINDKLVGQSSDADYATGEVGLFVQTVDVTNVHVHFDAISVSKIEISLLCTVKALTLNVRSGPSTSSPSAGHLDHKAILQPIGRNAKSTWLQINLQDTGKQGWVYLSPQFVTCVGPVDTLPVVNP